MTQTFASTARRFIPAMGVLLGAAVLVACGTSPSHTGSGGSGSAAPAASSAREDTTTSTVATLPFGQQGSAPQVPWSQVGSGWILVTWQAQVSRSPAGQASLFLVDPAGGRYLISTSAPVGTLAAWGSGARVALFVSTTGSASSLPTIVTGVSLTTGLVLYQKTLPTYFGDFARVSGDGERALLSSIGQQSEVTQLDLSTGNVLNEFNIPGTAQVDYTTPKGKALAVTNQGTVTRDGMDGSVQLQFPASFSQIGTGNSGFLYSSDGGTLAIGAAGGIAIVSNSGALVSQLTVPGAANNGSQSGCQPVQWWPGNSLLASCNSSQGSEYWIVPLAGAAPTQLGNVETPGAPVWQVGSTDFSTYDACSSSEVTELNNRSFAVIHIPGLDPNGSTSILGVTPNALEVLGQQGCATEPSGATSPPPLAGAVELFDPSGNSATTVLGPDANGGSVISAIGYPTGPYGME